MSRNRPVALVLALLLAFVGVALAGDEAAARRAIKSAREQVEGERPELAETYVTQARRYMEGLPAATVKQLEDELVVIEARISERKRLREQASLERTVRLKIKFARDNVESDINFRPDQAMMHLQQARKEMEKLPPEMIRQMEEEIRAIEGLISEKRRVHDRDAALQAIDRAIIRSSASDLEGWGHRTLGCLVLVKRYEEKLKEYYAFDNGYALRPEDKAAHQKYLAEFKTKCEAHEIETRFTLAEEECQHLEERDNWTDESVAEGQRDLDELLKPGNVPQTDPRVNQLKQRYQRAIAAKQKGAEEAIHAEKVERLTSEWSSRKSRFQRDCPAWADQLGNEYPKWVETKQHGLEKATRRWDVAADMMDDDVYKDCVNFFKDDPAVGTVVKEVETWRREAADRLFKKADELLAEAEKSAGADQKPALEALVADLEEKAPASTSGAATLTRARTALAAAGGAPVPSGVTDAGDDAPTTQVEGGGVGILGVLFGLVCCFGFLAVVGVGGFLAYKHVNAAKAGPPPGAPPAV